MELLDCCILFSWSRGFWALPEPVELEEEEKEREGRGLFETQVNKLNAKSSCII